MLWFNDLQFSKYISYYLKNTFYFKKISKGFERFGGYCNFWGARIRIEHGNGIPYLKFKAINYFPSKHLRGLYLHSDRGNYKSVDTKY